jgi:hypothetical protein
MNPSSTGSGGLTAIGAPMAVSPCLIRRLRAAFQNAPQRPKLAAKAQKESEFARVQTRRVLVGQNWQIIISGVAVTLAELSGRRSNQFGKRHRISQNLLPLRLFCQNRHAASVKAVHGKTVFFDIKSDCGNRVYGGWLSRWVASMVPSWRINAARGSRPRHHRNWN